MQTRSDLIEAMAAGAHEQQRMPGERTFAKAGEIERQVWLERMEAALAAAEAAGGVFVPHVPTEQMMRAAILAMASDADDSHRAGYGVAVRLSPFRPGA